MYELNKKQKIILIILASIIAIAICYYVYAKDESSISVNNEEIEVEETAKEDKKETEEDSSDIIMAHITGAVNNPGIYSFNNQERIIDVINQAGGLTNDADTTVINLSKKIKDEMVIIIYTKEEVKNFIKVKEEEVLKNTQCISKTPVNNSCIEENVDVDSDKKSKISINTATLEELLTLSGIGEAKAKSIIEYREKNGAFTSLEDLTKVDGIGQALFDKIKENISL